MSLVCVYCASSARVDSVYFDATERLGREFVRCGIDVIYGGGSIGLMGCLADTVLAAGGQVTGVIPKFMDDVEWSHQHLTKLIFTETMHQRKARMIEGIDAVIALPGSTGTFEELFEVITLKRLGLFDKPIIILNTNNYYEPLKEMLNKCVAENFMRPKHLTMWSFVDEPENVIKTLRNTPKWNKDAIKFAVVQ
ncbi:MAG: TIGR00730 family Rossman fold protein [Planctomycetaceae bacterium]|nr:TIGR00730 family Rossman fold protein [Planctomycetaceae bacterium]